MGKDTGVSYIGPPDLHDGRIIRVEQHGNLAVVFIQGASGHNFAIEFSGVTKLNARQAEGMLLYALAEWAATRPARRFVFANWDEESDTFLEILAKDYRVVGSEHPGSSAILMPGE